jgi:hypothetical protein
MCSPFRISVPQKCDRRQPGEGRQKCLSRFLRITYNADRRIGTRRSRLLSTRRQEDAEEALIAVTRCVTRGEPFVRCQLLASLFYEELLRQLRECPDHSDRVILGTAAVQCGRAAIASATSGDLIRGLRSAIAALLKDPGPSASPSRPVLRVIQGGLSKT